MAAEESEDVNEDQMGRLCVRLEDFGEGLERPVEVNVTFVPSSNSTTSNFSYQIEMAYNDASEANEAISIIGMD